MYYRHFVDCRKPLRQMVQTERNPQAQCLMGLCYCHSNALGSSEVQKPSLTFNNQKWQSSHEGTVSEHIY